MDVTNECISRILDLKEILLSFQTAFSLANAAVACAILSSEWDELKHVVWYNDPNRASTH